MQRGLKSQPAFAGSHTQHQYRQGQALALHLYIMFLLIHAPRQAVAHMGHGAPGRAESRLDLDGGRRLL